MASTATTFRGISILQIQKDTAKKLDWHESDRLLFLQHAARYQIISRSDLEYGIDELVEALGIAHRPESYKSPIIKRAQSSILNLVQKKLREGRHKILIETDEIDSKGRNVWRWPEFSKRFLGPDWQGVRYALPGEDPTLVRRDRPGQRARTPEPDRRNGRHARQETYMSGALLPEPPLRSGRHRVAARSRSRESGARLPRRNQSPESGIECPRSSFRSSSSNSWYDGSDGDATDTDNPDASTPSPSTYPCPRGRGTRRSGASLYSDDEEENMPYPRPRGRVPRHSGASLYSDVDEESRPYFSDDRDRTIRRSRDAPFVTPFQTPRKTNPGIERDSDTMSEIRSHIASAVKEHLAPVNRKISLQKEILSGLVQHKRSMTSAPNLPTVPTEEPKLPDFPDPPKEEPSWEHIPPVTPRGPQPGYNTIESLRSRYPDVHPSALWLEAELGTGTRSCRGAPPFSAYAIPHGARFKASHMLLSQACEMEGIQRTCEALAKMAHGAGDAGEAYHWSQGVKVAGEQAMMLSEKALDAAIQEDNGVRAHWDSEDSDEAVVPWILQRLLGKQTGGI